MISLGSMVKLVEALHDTPDLSDWENKFVESIVRQTEGGKNTTRLTEKQISVIEGLYKKHYGD